MTRAPHPPVAGAPEVDRLHLWSIVSEARDLIVGLSGVIEDARNPGASGEAAAAFGIAITAVVLRHLDEASALLDEPDTDKPRTALPDIGRQGAVGELPGAVGADAPLSALPRSIPAELQQLRVAGGRVVLAHAVQTIRGGAVIHGRPGGGQLLGIVVGPEIANEADSTVQVQITGSCAAFIASEVRRGQLLTVDRDGALVPARPKQGKPVHCIAIAEEDCPGKQPALVFVERGTLQA